MMPMVPLHVVIMSFLVSNFHHLHLHSDLGLTMAVHVPLLLISASRRGGSDDSQEELRPRKHAGKRPVISESSSSEGSDYEEEMEEEEERGARVTFSSRPRGSRRASHMPAPPPDQPHDDGCHIPFEAPQLHGCILKDFTKVPKPTYFKFRRDVNQFEVVQDSLDQRKRTNVQADIYTSVVLHKGLSLHHFVDLEHIRKHPVKYPGAIELIESSGLAAPFAF